MWFIESQGEISLSWGFVLKELAPQRDQIKGQKNVAIKNLRYTVQ